MDKIYFEEGWENADETMIEAPRKSWKDNFLAVGKSAGKGAVIGALKEFLKILDDSDN